MSRRLGDFVAAAELPAGWAEMQISALCQDSRKVVPGAAFVALPGSHGHGLDHVQDACRRGASLLIIDASVSVDVDLPQLRLAGLPSRLSALAAAYYGHPGQALATTAVTGTNGKTSCAHLLAQAWHVLGRTAGVLGTLGNGVWGGLQPGTHTTADAISLQEHLLQLRQAGVSHLAMEASSHGLHQHRMDAVPLQCAVFTNLTRDHLDYHPDMQHYADAKARLFGWPHLQRAVINIDDPWAEVMLKALGPSVSCLRYGQGERADIRLLQAQTTLAGVSGELATPWGPATLRSSLLGAFNLHNLLAVLACLLGEGIDLARALALIARLQPVAGRMQTLQLAGKPLVVVDYAHTPDALLQVLKSLQAHQQSRLICVFGCGGERDRGKRPLMTAIACQHADQVWLTSDNPRHEDPAQIVMEMQAGATQAVQIELDRATAIAQAIAQAGPEDIVLIAGKGHETYQDVVGVRHAFDDREHARAALETWTV